MIDRIPRRTFCRRPTSAIGRFLRREWARLADGELRLVFPPGQEVWSAIRRRGDLLEVDPGGLRPSFIVDFSKAKK